MSLAIVIWCTFKNFAKEVCVAVQYFLRGNSKYTLLIPWSTLLNFKELIRFDQQEIDLLQDFEVKVYQVFIACLTFLERHEIAKCQIVAETLV